VSKSRIWRARPEEEEAETTRHFEGLMATLNTSSHFDEATAATATLVNSWSFFSALAEVV